QNKEIVNEQKDDGRPGRHRGRTGRTDGLFLLVEQHLVGRRERDGQQREQRGIPQQLGRGAGFAERLAVVQPERPRQARRRAGGGPQGQEPVGGQHRDGRQRRGRLLEGRSGRLPRRLQG